MIGNILFYGALALLMWGIDLLLADVVGNALLRIIAAALIATAVALIAVIGFHMARERWPWA